MQIVSLRQSVFSGKKKYIITLFSAELAQSAKVAAEKIALFAGQLCHSIRTPKTTALWDRCLETAKDINQIITGFYVPLP